MLMMMMILMIIMMNSIRSINVMVGGKCFNRYGHYWCFYHHSRKQDEEEEEASVCLTRSIQLTALKHSAFWFDVDHHQANSQVLHSTLPIYLLFHSCSLLGPLVLVRPFFCVLSFRLLLRCFCFCLCLLTSIFTNRVYVLWTISKTQLAKFNVYGREWGEGKHNIISF